MVRLGYTNLHLAFSTGLRDKTSRTSLSSSDDDDDDDTDVATLITTATMTTKFNDDNNNFEFRRMVRLELNRSFSRKKYFVRNLPGSV